MKDRTNQTVTITKKLVVIYNEDDEHILDMTVRQLQGMCDFCPNEATYILRLDDGNIYGLCEDCMKKIR
jgi:hypothetical protein